MSTSVAQPLRQINPMNCSLETRSEPSFHKWGGQIAHLLWFCIQLHLSSASNDQSLNLKFKANSGWVDRGKTLGYLPKKKKTPKTCKRPFLFTSTPNTSRSKKVSIDWIEDVKFGSCLDHFLEHDKNGSWLVNPGCDVSIGASLVNRSS